MSGWVKTPVDWFERDDIEALGARGRTPAPLRACVLRAPAHGRAGTEAQLRRLWPVLDQGRCVDALMSAGAWEDAGDDYFIPGWHEHILASEEVAHIREQTRARVERHRRHKAAGTTASCTGVQ